MELIPSQVGFSLTAPGVSGVPRAKGVTFEVMDKICEALECQPGELFEKVASSK